MNLFRLSSARSANADAAVRATNDDAFASKVAAVQKGYYEDQFVSAIASQFPQTACFGSSTVPEERFRRTPLINRGTFARVLLKNIFVKGFRRHNSAGSIQIVSLGAGFDTLPFQLIDDAGLYPPFRFVEIDFPDVVKAKIDIVRNVPRISRLFESVTNTEHGISAREAGSFDALKSTYSLHGCDLRDLSALSTVLREASIDFTCPTLFLAEIVLIYMEPKHSDNLIKFLADSFTGNTCFINIEHIGPDDPFGREMMRNIAARGSPLLGIKKYPTIESQKNRFRKFGWADGEGFTFLEAFQRALNRSQTLNLNRIEPLDETEEWVLIMQHYCIMVAVDSGQEGEDLQGMLKSCLSQGLSKSVMSSPV